jgi:hypothetical protein
MLTHYTTVFPNMMVKTSYPATATAFAILFAVGFFHRVTFLAPSELCQAVAVDFARTKL